MTPDFKHTKYDAIIVGARCAGAATALLLARSGAHVLLVDREKTLTDTLSTHALMRPAVTLLHRWGLLRSIVEGGTPVVTRTQFHYGTDIVDIPVKSDAEIAGLYAPRRWLLDGTLREAAVRAGAEFHSGTRFLDIMRGRDSRVVGADFMLPDGTVQTAFADIVIGADGRESNVANCVVAATTAVSSATSATVYTYVEGIANEGYRWYFGHRTTAGLIPTTNGAHCLFASCAPRDFASRLNRDPYAGVMESLAAWEPKLAEDLARRGPLERMRRFGGAPGRIRRCAGPGWALVGDAGYYKDPATAHGITDAFLDANRLAHALGETRGDASAYEAARDEIAPELFTVTQEIASLEWDFERLNVLHMQLNDCIKAEQSALPDSKIKRSIAA